MKRKILILLISIVLTTLFVVGSYIGIKYVQNTKANQSLIKEMKAHYHEWVSIENGNLYCQNEKQYEICGKIESKMIVPLESVVIQTIQNQYFQIKGTPYYLFYTEVNPVEFPEIESPNYVEWNQNVYTKDQTNLYQSGEKVLSISQSMSFPVFYQDDENYYVKYLEQIFAISKEESIGTIEQPNTETAVATQIPVLYYDDVETWKDTQTGKEQLALLKEKGFYSISPLEYETWLHGNARLKENAILLLSQKNTLVENYQFYNKNDISLPLLEANAVSEQNKPYYYHVNMTTTKEQFERMLVGDSVITSDWNQKVAVLNYHFFYNPDGGEACNENICLSTSKLEEQFQYLKNNGYHTLTMREFRDWMYGKIDIPEKSVLLTIDDGAMGTGKHNGHKLIPLLEKYDLHATLFLITGWWDIENYRSSNLDVESHTNDMHTMYQNGAQLLISTNEQVMNDLRQSIAITNSKTAFCFPFYAYNEIAIEQVKNVGFELAFVGGNNKASRKNDKYKIPRYPIYKNITMQQFIDMIS